MPTPASVAMLDFEPNVPLHPSPRDWRDQVIYFLLVDRFDDHRRDPPPYVAGTPPPARDPAAGRRFQGGTLRGILRRLDYIQGLGCNTVWLSPIFKNRLDLDDTYHGYGVQDFLAIDPRFGTQDDLRALIAAAHARGMYVILDIIFNHAGDVWAYPGGFPYYYAGGQRFPFGHWRQRDAAAGLQRDDAVWPIEIQDPEAFKRKGEIRNWWDPVEARDGDFLSLKELDINRSDVLDTLIHAYKYWIVNADIDGFRIDTVKHMEQGNVAIFCNAIREYARRVGKDNFFIFGEIVADDATIQHYLGRNARIDGTDERFPSLDAALDFPLYFILEEAIKGFGDLAALRGRYASFRNNYTDHGAASRYFVTFIDNHDQMARPYRRFMHNNPHWRQAALAATYLLTSQGIPCLYYGTEQGFDGGGDNDVYVRECMFGGQWGAFGSQGMHCFNPQHPIYLAIQAVARVRAEQPALRYGRQYFREIALDGQNFHHPQDGRCTLAWSRILDSHEVLVALNLDSGARSDFITVDRNLSAPGRRLRNLLAPDQSFEVIENNGRACMRLPLPEHGMAIIKAD